MVTSTAVPIMKNMTIYAFCELFTIFFLVSFVSNSTNTTVLMIHSRGVTLYLFYEIKIKKIFINYKIKITKIFIFIK
jgi:hypothetical protein